MGGNRHRPEPYWFTLPIPLSLILLSGIKFLFEKTLKREWVIFNLVRPQKRKKLPVVLSTEEIKHLLSLVRITKSRMALTVIYACGLRLNEGLRLKVQDIDSQRRLIWIRNGKGGKDRYVPLAERLLVPYFHAVFTLPKELHEIIGSNQKIGYALIMEAAALSLTKLAKDTRYVGGQIGMLAVLHTWTRALVYHPHAHCLIPAGGLSPDHRYWLNARKNYLVPVRALSEIFRATFMTLIRRKLPKACFPQSVWNRPWVVYCKSSAHTADKTLAYLARYVHQTAITNSRILNADNGKVTFRYKDSIESRWKTMTLDASEFMRRFLLHVSSLWS